MSSETPEDKKRVEEALKDSAKLKELVEALSDGSRRGRLQSAKVIAGVSAENPVILVPFASDLVDALERPEAQTRWECLDALTYVVSFDSRPCDKAIPGAEAALFDEDSGPLRLAAMRFLCKLGATTEKRSEKVWHPVLSRGFGIPGYASGGHRLLPGEAGRVCEKRPGRSYALRCRERQGHAQAPCRSDHRKCSLVPRRLTHEL